MIPGTDLWIGTGVYIDNIAEAQAKVAEELENAAARSLIYRLFIGAGFALPVLPLTIFLIRSIITPLKRMIGMLKDIAQGEGDLTARLQDNSAPKPRSWLSGSMHSWSRSTASSARSPGTPARSTRPRPVFWPGHAAARGHRTT